MKKKKENFESIKCVDKAVILEFENELEAKIFEMAYMDLKTGKKDFEGLERKGNWIRITYPTKRKALVMATIFESSKEEPYQDPMARQGKRCKC